MNTIGRGHHLNRRVPEWMDKAAAISWRLVVIGAAIYFIFQALEPVGAVVLAIIIALFPSSLLWGPVRGLKRRGWPPILATWTVLLGALALTAGVGTLMVPALVEGIEPVAEDVATAYDDLQVWLVEGPLGLSPAEVDHYADMLVEQIQSGAGVVATGLLSGAAVAVEVVTGLVLVLIVTFFLLKDGDRLRDSLVARLSPERGRQVEIGARVAWRTLNNYVKGLALVGLIDAVAIAIGLLILGVPLVVPLAILVFIGAFFPIVGAFLSGLVAVAVALVNGGLTDALIVLAIITAVQQLEGDIIYPMVFGKTMQLHPLVVLLAIAIGGFAFGIAGAFLSVPLTAVIVAVNHQLNGDPDRSLIGMAKTIE